VSAGNQSTYCLFGAAFRSGSTPDFGSRFLVVNDDSNGNPFSGLASDIQWLFWDQRSVQERPIFVFDRT
jgi:hypothetical protein